MRHRRSVLFGAGAWALSLVGILGCAQVETPTSTADCEKSRGCHENGRCAFDRKGNNCVVGSDAHCAKSNLCHKENRCRMVGNTCDR